MKYTGSCHCGAIGFEYRTDVDPSRWSVRACQCSFCLAHGALTTSDPTGLLRFRVAAADVIRYRFGLRTADFLICARCGVYIGAQIELPGAARGIINARALKPAPPLPAGQPMSYEGEAEGERSARRQARWTPLEASR
jgi:hypothetical protein